MRQFVLKIDKWYWMAAAAAAMAVLALAVIEQTVYRLASMIAFHHWHLPTTIAFARPSKWYARKNPKLKHTRKEFGKQLVLIILALYQISQCKNAKMVSKHTRAHTATQTSNKQRQSWQDRIGTVFVVWSSIRSCIYLFIYLCVCALTRPLSICNDERFDVWCVCAYVYLIIISLYHSLLKQIIILVNLSDKSWIFAPA